MPDLLPPSAELLPPTPALRERLSVALREVDLLHRLIRAAESSFHHDPRPAPRHKVTLGVVSILRTDSVTEMIVPLV